MDAVANSAGIQDASEREVEDAEVGGQESGSGCSDAAPPPTCS